MTNYFGRVSSSTVSDTLTTSSAAAVTTSALTSSTSEASKQFSLSTGSKFHGDTCSQRRQVYLFPTIHNVYFTSRFIHMICCFMLL